MYDLKLIKFILIILISFILSTKFLSAEKFIISGDTIIYDTFKAKNEFNQEINWDDVTEFEYLMRNNEGIKNLQLNSSGGLVEAAIYLSDIIIDYELNTHVDGECSSSCVFLFLGGEKRSLQRGSWIGFHKSSWSKEGLKEYYESYKDEKGWLNEFEFSEWLYNDTQVQILRDLKYLIERGVDGNFAIKTLTADSDDMWYPRRKELEAAGVVNIK